MLKLGFSLKTPLVGFSKPTSWFFKGKPTSGVFKGKVGFSLENPTSGFLHYKYSTVSALASLAPLSEGSIWRLRLVGRQAGQYRVKYSFSQLN